MYSNTQSNKLGARDKIGMQIPSWKKLLNQRKEKKGRMKDNTILGLDVRRR